MNPNGACTSNSTGGRSLVGVAARHGREWFSASAPRSVTSCRKRKWQSTYFDTGRNRQKCAFATPCCCQLAKRCARWFTSAASIVSRERLNNQGAESLASRKSERPTRAGKGLGLGNGCVQPAQVKRSRQVLPAWRPGLRDPQLSSRCDRTPCCSGLELRNLMLKDVQLSTVPFARFLRVAEKGGGDKGTRTMRLVQGKQHGTWKMDCRVSARAPRLMSSQRGEGV